MAISDYSTTPASNGTIGGINVSEGCAPGNLNDAIRQMAADLKTFWNTFQGALASYQPLATVLTAISGLTTAADKGLYFTGSNTPATFDLTSFARTMLATSDAATLRGVIGAAAATITGTATSGKINFGTFVLTWRDQTVSGNGSTSCAYGGDHNYTSWARAWFSGGEQDTTAIDNDPFVSSAATTAATVFNARNGSIAGTLFSIGV